MDTHLTEEQIAERLLGADDEAAAGHLEGCARCRAEVDSSRDSISGFCRSIHAAAERDPVFWAHQRAAIRERLLQRTARFPRWAALAAAALLLLAVLLFTRPSQVHQTASNDAADDILLQQVAGDVERDYPQALGPAVLISQERSSVLAQKAQP